VAELLELIVDLPADRRADALLAACPSDVDLRQEALSLASQLDGAGVFLEPTPREQVQDLSGRVVGPYEIKRRLGEGGMGTVYEAVDTRLDRTVAIKSLSSAVGVHASVAARLTREAKALAQLNHPGIASIYGVETYLPAPGGVVLVLEYVPGITLGQRLKLGAIACEDVIRIAMAIADALEAAHARGIIHRDLKPSNIMLNESAGELSVKVLDFGLAKAIHGLAPHAEAADPTRTPATPFATPRTPSIAADMTAEGEVMGTAAYMSPEQARAAMVDRRADLWALGCVLYEMLTGRRLFDRGSSAETLAAVLAEVPPLDALPEGLPPTLRLLVRRCLRKDPRERLRDAGDARLMLAESLEELKLSPASDVSRRRRRLRATVGGIALGCMLSGAAIALLLVPRAKVERESLAFDVILSPTPPPRDESNPLAISHDGRTIIAAVGEEESARLVMRRLGEATPIDIPGTHGAGSPCISPDDAWIAFVDSERGEFRKVRMDGGPVVTIGHGSSFAQLPLWLPDGRIVHSVRWTPGVMVLDPATGVTEEMVFSPPIKRPIVRLGNLLPDGETALATLCDDSSSKRQIEALNIRTRARRTIMESASDPMYLGGGRLAFVRDRALLMVPFDPDRLKIIGPELPLSEGLALVEAGGGAAVRGEHQTIAYEPAGLGTDIAVAWVSTDGTLSPILQGAGAANDPRVSPDGNRIAVGMYRDTSNLFVVELKGAKSVPHRLTEGLCVTRLAWSPDGKRIAFNASAVNSSRAPSNVPGGRGIYVVDADGATAPRLLRGFASADARVYDWSRDGRYLAISVQPQGGAGFDTVLLEVEHPDAELKPLLTTSAGEFGPAFSHDGRWIAFTRDFRDEQDVYIAPYPAASPIYRVSTLGGYRARWTADDKRLYFLNGKKFYSVQVDVSGSEPVISEPTLMLSGVFNGQYDIGPDGRIVATLQRRADNTALRVMTGVGSNTK
jgi:serine/threonine-protein kinase